MEQYTPFGTERSSNQSDFYLFRSGFHLERRTIMKFFFGVSDNPAHLKYIPPVDVMISAYRFKFLINRRYAKKYLNRAESIFVDSGFISAWKAGTWKRWLDKQDYVLSCAKKAKADIVAMLDLPMEPKLQTWNLRAEKHLDRYWFGLYAHSRGWLVSDCQTNSSRSP